MSERSIKESIPEFLLRLWNVYSFFVIYANIDEFDPTASIASPGQLTSDVLQAGRGYRPLPERGELDRWIISELNRTIRSVVHKMDAYDSYGACADLNDFVAGMKIVLAPDGVVTMEFPHLMRLMEENQFDTIYHEHFSYFSLLSTEKIFSAHGLTLFDVERLPTHGGSLRIYARHDGDETKPITARLIDLREEEAQAGFAHLDHYLSFGEQVRETKRKLLEFLIQAKREGKAIAGYGAPGKGNTLLNYCGIRTDFIDYTVDRNPYKQGKFLPGTHIPIFGPEKISETKPDYVLILPWNFKDEIMDQMAGIREWGGRFVVPIPEVTIHP